MMAFQTKKNLTTFITIISHFFDLILLTLIYPSFLPLSHRSFGPIGIVGAEANGRNELNWAICANRREEGEGEGHAAGKWATQPTEEGGKEEEPEEGRGWMMQSKWTGGVEILGQAEGPKQRREKAWRMKGNGNGIDADGKSQKREGRLMK
jgi:hypothetical protein